jgi:hypothetical protein
LCRILSSAFSTATTVGLIVNVYLKKPLKVLGRRGLKPKVYECRKALAYPIGGTERHAFMLALASVSHFSKIKYVTA